MGKVLKLDSKYMLTPAFFKRRWLEEHGKLINISDTKWRELINYWSSIATYQKNTNPNTDQYIADTILEKLSECNVTIDKQLATVQRNYFFTEDNPITALYYPTKGVKDIIDSTKLKTDMARVHNALKDSLVSTSKVIKVGNKSVRFWAFKPDLMDINWNNRLKEELENE
jgi:hypothetical protein